MPESHPLTPNELHSLAALSSSVASALSLPPTAVTLTTVVDDCPVASSVAAWSRSPDASINAEGNRPWVRSQESQLPWLRQIPQSPLSDGDDGPPAPGLASSTRPEDVGRAGGDVTLEHGGGTGAPLLSRPASPPVSPVAGAWAPRWQQALQALQAQALPASDSVPQLGAVPPRPAAFPTSGSYAHAAVVGGPGPGLAPTIYVAASGGSDSADCGPEASPCATLQYAVSVRGNAAVPTTAMVSLVLGPGRYGPDSCGADAGRPMNISGAGSEATVIDCAGTGRALVTNDSLALSGVTITRGHANVTVTLPRPDDDDLGLYEFAGGGGGGVAVMWTSGLPAPWATLIDVAFSSNTVSVEVIGEMVTTVVGGGGLYVAGEGNSAAVTLRRCTFVSNYVEVQAGSDVANTVACGGGACVALGLPVQPTSSVGPVSGTMVALTDVVAASNTLLCDGSACLHAGNPALGVCM